MWFSESDLLSMGRILQEGGGAEKRVNDQGLNISHSPAFHACVLAPPLNGTNGLSHLFHRTTSLEEKTRRGNNVELFFFMVQYVLGRRHIHCGGVGTLTCLPPVEEDQQQRAGQQGDEDGEAH